MLGPPSPQEGGRHCPGQRREEGRESSRPRGRLTTRGGERAGRRWRAGGTPGRWSQALELGGRRGEGQRETPPHSIPSWRAKPLHQDDTPSPQVLRMAFRNLPGDHLIWVEGSRSLPHQQPASPLPVGTPASPPHRQQHLPPFETAASAPPMPHPHPSPPVQQPLKYRLNLAHTCLNLLESLLAP